MNSHGVYFYDGRGVQSLTDNKIRNMWLGEDGHTAFWMSDAQDVPVIGYDPKTKKILCSKTSSAEHGSDSEHILFYDLKQKSWSYAVDELTNNVNKTNMVVFRNQLMWVNDTDDDIDNAGSNLVVKKWSDTPEAQGDVLLATKDIDFGAPSVRKKIYKVYISYKGDASALNVRYFVNGETDTSNLKQFKIPSGSADNTPLVDKSSTANRKLWHAGELKPATSSEANGIYSFRLYMDGTTDEHFEINDITIVYRVKSIK